MNHYRENEDDYYQFDEPPKRCDAFLYGLSTGTPAALKFYSVLIILLIIYAFFKC